MDDLDLLRLLRPQTSAPSGEQKHRARVSLAGVATSRRRTGWTLLRPRRAVLVALAVAILVVGLARGPLGLLSPADPAAAAAFQQAARAAAQAEPLDVGDGYVYQKIDAMWAFSSAKFTYLRPLAREFWLAADGSGRIRETSGEPIFLSEAEREVFVAGGYEVLSVNEDLGPGDGLPHLIPGLFGVESLPNDVDAVRDMVRSVAEDTHPWGVDTQMFVVIRDLLRDPFTPPDTRAVLFEVAADLPGMEFRGEVTDRVGRRGIEVAMTSWFQREIVVFDPVTSALLEERTERLLPYGDEWPPITWGYATYLETAVVPSLPAE